MSLEGRQGTLLLGRAFTTVYDFVRPYYPMGYAPQYSWVVAIAVPSPRREEGY